MKWFILNNFIDFFPQLREAGVVVKKQNITEPSSITGICFPEDELARVKEMTRIEILGETRTNIENVFLLSVISETEVMIEPRNQEAEKARHILEEYARKHSTKILLHNTHGGSCSPVDGDWVHIFPYCAPEAKRGGEIRRVFDIEAPGYGTEDCVVPKIDAIMPLADPAGVIYGEVGGRGNNLYIYFDMFHSWSEAHEKIFRKILEHYFSYISSRKFKKLQQEIVKKEEKLEKESRERYIEFVEGRKSAAITDLKREIDETERRIENLSKQLTETCRNYDQFKERLAAIQEKDDFFEELGLEYDRLLTHPSVVKLRAQNGKVEVFTKFLILEGYKIGEFKVTMYLDGQYSCENLTQRIESQNHPHVSSDPYDCCFGTAKSEIKKLIRGFQFEVAFHKIWGRLNRYDSENPYLNIKNWPKA